MPRYAATRKTRPSPYLALLLALLLAGPALAQAAPDPGARARLQVLAGEVSVWWRTLATATGGEPARVRQAAAEAHLARAMQAPDAGIRLRRAADLAAPGRWFRIRTGLLEALSNDAYRRGDMAAVEAVEREALADARLSGNRLEQAGSLYGLAMAAQGRGELDAAIGLFQQAISQWETLGARRQVAIGERGLARVYESRGQYAEAVQLQVDALEHLLEDGRPIDQSESYYSLAKLFHNLGDHAAALQGADRAIALMGQNPPDFPLGLNLALRSQVHADMGTAEAALADAVAATAAFGRSGGDLGLALGNVALGPALALNDRRDDALAALRAGREAAGRIGERVLEADLALREGDLLVGMGKPGEALAPLAFAEGVAVEGRLERMVLDVSLAQERAFSALGQTDQALAASKRAFEFRDRIGRLDELGQRASGSASARDRFMGLVPATAAPGAPAAAPPGGLPRWPWLLAIPSLLLGWGLLRLRRHVRHLRAERRVMDERQRALETEHLALRERVAVDPLTGALTRQAFAAELSSLLGHARNHGRSVALLVFDLDNFKAINDRLGHLAGDEALRLAAGIARGKLRSDDLLGRFGGDEFLVACEGLDQAAAEALAEQLRFDLVWRAPDADPPMDGLSLSVGAAVADPSRGYDAGDLFHRADSALYRAKRAGRNRVMGDDPACATQVGDGSRRARQWGEALAD
ncbi:diguanylate cyclase [Arenimonas sp.]|uniref:diguanylate cyclase n=1 Tax=Arenimonas sp. TaxID=1872635 RepID=UPI0035B1B6B5